MKIAYLINQYPQPSHTFIRREIQALEAQGLTVTRYTIRRPGVKLADPADQAERERTRAVLETGAIGLAAAMARVKLTRPCAYWRAFKLARKLAKASERGLALHLIYLAEACVLLEWTRREQIQHVHAHFGTNSTAVAMLLRELGGPTYSFTCHGPDEYDRPITLSLGEKIVRSAFTVVISSFGRSQMFRWAPHEHWDKVKIVHCGVDASFLGAEPAPLPAAKKLVNVGRLQEAKGQLLLVQACALLKQRGVDFHLDIIGDGSLRAALEKLIHERGMEGNVRLLGVRSGPEVRAAFDQSRGLVLPSFAEGLPVVIMEALSRHRPAIATAIAGVPDLVKPNETGWLIPAGDVEAIADAMQQALAADDATITRMGAAGARLVSQNHDVNIEAAKLARHFRDVVGAD